MGTSEEILLRVMVKGDTIVPGAIRFELMSEHDVQFYYQATIKEENFRQIQIANDLMIEYDSFFATFQKLLQECLDRPHSHRVSFTLDDDDGNACLRFLLDSEFKSSELLVLDNFRQLDDEKINMQVSYRINSLKQKSLLVVNRMRELTDILQSNNPNLCEQIQRVVNGVRPDDYQPAQPHKGMPSSASARSAANL
jgi:hypothetical protein